jgi:uncharacterized protein (TIGR00725 family)
MKPHVSVIGGSNADPADLAAAEQVGRLLAERGCVVVCGGLSGVMEAVCRGAKAAGGLTVGIIPGKDPAAANRFVDVCVCTSMGYARNALVACSGQAVIAVGGGVGTLSEIALALNFDRPVVTLGSWQLDRSRFTRGERLAEAATAAEAVEMALAAIGAC